MTVLDTINLSNNRRLRFTEKHLKYLLLMLYINIHLNVRGNI